MRPDLRRLDAAHAPRSVHDRSHSPDQTGSAGAGCHRRPAPRRAADRRPGRAETGRVSAAGGRRPARRHRPAPGPGTARRLGSPPGGCAQPRVRRRPAGPGRVERGSAPRTRLADVREWAQGYVPPRPWNRLVRRRCRHARRCPRHLGGAHHRRPRPVAATRGGGRRRGLRTACRCVRPRPVARSSRRGTSPHRGIPGRRRRGPARRTERECRGVGVAPAHGAIRSAGTCPATRGRGSGRAPVPRRLLLGIAGRRRRIRRCREVRRPPRPRRREAPRGRSAGPRLRGRAVDLGRPGAVRGRRPNDSPVPSLGNRSGEPESAHAGVWADPEVAHRFSEFGRPPSRRTR